MQTALMQSSSGVAVERAVANRRPAAVAPRTTRRSLRIVSQVCAGYGQLAESCDIGC